MKLRRLKWIAILGPILFVALLEYAVYLLYPQLLSWPGRLVMAAVVVVAMAFFFGAVFKVIRGMQERLHSQNRELLALHRASLDIYGELSLDTVLQKVVDQARQLLEAKYGAVSVIDESGRIKEFVVSGVSPEERARIGDPPHGHGVLGLVLQKGQRLRLPEVSEHPRFEGFPAHHPPIHSLLAVPILCKSPFRGNLYIGEKETESRFSEEDEETVVRFATAAAIAIDNAQIHRQLRSLAVAEERVRIAHEMHDGMAQVLAYVNTKAQAVREYLRSNRNDQAAEQLEQLASAARNVYADAREGILALRTQTSPDTSLADLLPEFLAQWQDQSGISAELEVDGIVQLDANVELQLLRILQEALSNVRKHSNASRARLKLAQADTEVVAEVSDDGSGFSPASIDRGPGPRFGLGIMRERAESVGGKFEIDSAPGRGTRIRVVLPITARDI